MTSPSTVLKSLARELIHFVFPSHCIHCHGTDVDTPQLLCSSCKELIERVPTQECEAYKAAAVIKEGSALSLLKEAKGSFSEEAISTIAALMLVQMIELTWPVPEVIIPSPQDPLNVLLAQELSRLFDIPYKKWKRFDICSDQILLALSLEHSPPSFQDALEELAPKRIYQISFCT